MTETLVESWRRVWSATPGTTDPEAPFAIVSLADGTDEGFGGNMRAFRWAQSANYGALPSPALPNTFVAEAYDLGDPWHTPLCGSDGSFEGGAFAGQMCCIDKSAGLGPRCVGDHRGEWALNDTRDWAGLGTLHPRLKRPLGQRIAQGLHGTAYGGTGPITGPFLAGCQVSSDGNSLRLSFDSKLLRGEAVVFNSSNTIEREDTALYVLVNDTGFEPTWLATISANHQLPPCRGGDCPDQMHSRYVPFLLRCAHRAAAGDK